MNHQVDKDYGNESLFKPIGDLAKMIQEMTMEEYLTFVLRGTIPDRYN